MKLSVISFWSCGWKNLKFAIPRPESFIVRGLSVYYVIVAYFFFAITLLRIPGYSFIVDKVMKWELWSSEIMIMINLVIIFDNNT